MPLIEPFETYHSRYDRWFIQHSEAYLSELMAIKAMLPDDGYGLEIGVGTGRFAAPLGIAVGLDPSPQMLRYASKRGISIRKGNAEALPFADSTFDYVLIVTTICFVDDERAMLAEAYRVLKPYGCLVIGFIDRESPLGQHYLAQKNENVFYRKARFFSADAVQILLEEAQFTPMEWVQTLSKPLDKITQIEPIKSGRGEGAFIVVRAEKQEDVPHEMIL